MKYFTPQLIAMGRSSDDRVLNEHDHLWEQAGERYAAYLDQVRASFPPGVQHIDENYYLHDAAIRAMGRRKQSFVIILQLDTPPRSILTFTYDLVAEPMISKGASPAASSSADDPVDWQYDEFEMIPGKPPTWMQSILLSNGWEIQLHFRDVQVQEVEAVLPAPSNGRAGTASRAAAANG